MKQKDLHILIDGFAFQHAQIIYIKKGESEEYAISIEREIFYGDNDERNYMKIRSCKY